LDHSAVFLPLGSHQKVLKDIYSLSNLAHFKIEKPNKILVDTTGELSK
jgi:hypothetical protein